MNFKKAFVLVLLAFLLISTVNAAEVSHSIDRKGIIDNSSYETADALDIQTDENDNGFSYESSSDVLENIQTDDNNNGLEDKTLTKQLSEETLTTESEETLSYELANGDVNISFDEVMYEQDLGDIDVSLADNISGELCIKIDNETIYNETISKSSFKIPILLPEKTYFLIANIWPGMDCTWYTVNAYLNGVDLNLNKTLKIMKYPPDYSYLSFPGEVLTSNNHQMFVFPRSANGMVEIWLDGLLLNKTLARPVLYLENMNFTAGSHSWNVLFYNDSYYHDVNITANFTATDVIIRIPQTVNISHDDCISVETTYGKGTVRTYVDGVLAFTSKISDDYFVMSLEEYLKKDSKEVRVVYENGKVTREKTQQISISYDFDLISSDCFTYGQENLIEIILPDTLNNKLLKVEINGTSYNFTRPEYAGSNWIEIDISALAAGNYSMSISYSGDARFEAKDKIINFSIDYNIISPTYVEYKDSSSVYLNLPKDSSGNLIVYIDGGLLANQSMKNGFAKIKVDSLAPGRHNISAFYSSEDYEVSPYEGIIFSSGRMSVPYSFTAGENRKVLYEMPEGTTGYVIFTIDDVEHKVRLAKGKASYCLKNLEAGYHEIFIDYYINGEWAGGDYGEIEVKKSRIEIISYKLSSKAVKVRIKLNKPMKTTVYVKFNGRTYKIKTNAKGVGTFKKSLKMKKSKYGIRFSHLGSSLSKKLYKANLKVSKSKRKIFLKTIVNVKGVKVKFKVGKKTYAVKSNSKGIARISVKRPKAKKVVCKAIYFGCKAVKKVKL